MDVEQLKEDVKSGRVTAERLVAVIEMLCRRLGAAEKENEELKRQIREGGGGKGKLEESYSLRAEEQRQQARGRQRRERKKRSRRGRLKTAAKVAQAKRTEAVYPEGVAKGDCWLSHTRPVWRLEQGRAVLVAYQVYRGPGSRYGKIAGVMGRSEFGMEIVLAIAYQVYVVGLSFDKVCLLMNFFQSLRLRKSQVDALLHQLRRQWEHQFDHLCTLLAHSAVVYTDETSWSIRSVWAFLSEQARVILFGVHKDEATLAQILDPLVFQGLVVSDDAAVYANFTHSQKCWAHLLRKAIKLTLQEPHNAAYRDFTDRLLEIYRRACRVQRDGRLSDAGRQRKVAELDDQIVDLCGGVWALELPKLEGPADDFRLLCNELMKLMIAQQLFSFVTTPAAKSPSGQIQPVSGTNNESERTLRSAAQARATGRTSKTPLGARRQTVITSVLESLKTQLADWTLQAMIDEVSGWMRRGKSCFARLVEKLKLKPLETSILETLLPIPNG